MLVSVSSYQFIIATSKIKDQISIYCEKKNGVARNKILNVKFVIEF